MHNDIRITGARENNLKDVSLTIPKHQITVFTGVSGAGKYPFDLAIIDHLGIEGIGI